MYGFRPLWLRVYGTGWIIVLVLCLVCCWSAPLALVAAVTPSPD